MENFPLPDLPSELQVEAMITMDPETLAKYLKINKQNINIGNNINFWKNYFRSLSNVKASDSIFGTESKNPAIIDTLLELVRYNQYVMRAAYDAAKTFTILPLQIIGDLLLLCIMRNDVDNIKYLSKEYNAMGPIGTKIEQDQVENAFNIIISVVDDIVNTVTEEISPWWNIPFLIQDTFLVQIIIDKIGIKAVFNPALISSNAVINNLFYQVLVVLWSRKLETYLLKRFLRIVIRAGIDEAGLEIYLFHIANHLPVRLYKKIEQIFDNWREPIFLAAYITSPEDESHLLASTINSGRNVSSWHLTEDFTPDEYLRIVRKMPENIQGYYIHLYEVGYPEIRNMWEKSQL